MNVFSSEMKILDEIQKEEMGNSFAVCGISLLCLEGCVGIHSTILEKTQKIFSVFWLWNGKVKSGNIRHFESRFRFLGFSDGLSSQTCYVGMLTHLYV